MLYYDTLNSEQQISYLIKPIIEVLQEAGGQLDSSEIRDRISEKDEHIAEFEQKIYTSSKTGNQYKTGCDKKSRKYLHQYSGECFQCS